MQVVPGDIILVKDLVFANGVSDHSKRGRPCIVFFVDRTKEIVHFLSLTSRVEKVLQYDDCIIFDGNEQIGVINLEHVYQTGYDNITEVVNNAGKDFFRITRCFAEYHQATESDMKESYLQIASFYNENHDLINKILHEREKSFKDRRKNRDKLNRKHYEEDPIAKKLQKRQAKRHRIVKEQLNEQELGY